MYCPVVVSRGCLTLTCLLHPTTERGQCMTIIDAYKVTWIRKDGNIGECLGSKCVCQKRCIDHLRIIQGLVIQVLMQRE